MVFNVVIEKRAISDIQQAIDYYDQQQAGLGKKFLSEIEKHFSSLSINPFFQVKYSKVRCLPFRKFPFVIHFTVNEKRKEVYVVSVFHTSQNPDKWPKV